MGNFDLERFVAAQDRVFAQVERELAAGAKRSHWMWFVFPQLRGLGRSETARLYGLAGKDEAMAYLAHPVLGERLIGCTTLVNRVGGKSALDILGSPDDIKFRSCMTLFSTLQPEPFGEALGKYFGGVPDQVTMEMLDAA